MHPTPFDTPTPTRPWWKKKRFWIPAIIVAIGVASSGGNTDEDDEQETVAVEAVAEETTTTVEATTTTESAQDRLAADMAVWAASHIGTVTQMTVHFQAVSDAAMAGDFDGTGAACVELALFLEDNPIPSAPDPDVDRAVSEAITEFSDGAYACVAGVAAYDVDLIDESTSHFLAGTEALNEATELLAERYNG